MVEVEAVVMVGAAMDMGAIPSGADMEEAKEVTEVEKVAVTSVAVVMGEAKAVTVEVDMAGRNTTKPGKLKMRHSD